MREIPLISAPNQELLVTLGEQDCALAVYQRGDRVFMDVAVGETVVRRGAICMPGMGIVQGAQTGFAGQLYMVDEDATPDRQRPPQWTGLGTRWRLYHLTEADLAALEDAAAEDAPNG